MIILLVLVPVLLSVVAFTLGGVVGFRFSLDNNESLVLQIIDLPVVELSSLVLLAVAVFEGGVASVVDDDDGNLLLLVLGFVVVVLSIGILVVLVRSVVVVAVVAGVSVVVSIVSVISVVSIVSIVSVISITSFAVVLFSEVDGSVLVVRPLVRSVSVVSLFGIFFGDSGGFSGRYFRSLLG